nr:hypothetical protein [Tanacetum cinerariifolium]
MIYDLTYIIAFGGNPKGGKITGKDTECVVLSSDFKLPDENFVLLRVPRENNMYNFCGMKGIKREFSVARTPQQNRDAKRKNKTLIEAARTMLVDSLLPISFWAESVNTACYVQNRVLVTKPHNKTPYELFLGRTPSIGFMRPFGCSVTILNTQDPLGKFDGNEGFLVGYSVSSKAFRVFNSRTKINQETLHINFLENQPNVVGNGPTWLFDIDTLTQSMNYQPVVNTDADVAFDDKDNESEVYVSPSSSDRIKKHDEKAKRKVKGKSHVDLSTRVGDLSDGFEEFSVNSTNGVNTASTPTTTVGPNSTNNTNSFNVVDPSNNVVSSNFEIGRRTSFVDPSQYLDDRDMTTLKDIVYSDDKEDVGADANFSNLETSITVSPIPTTRVHKDHLVTQIIGDLSLAPQTRSMARMVKRTRHTQEEGIDYEEVFAPVVRIKVIRLFLAYASFMGFMVYQMDVKSAFLYGTIEKEVYVCQPLGFEDLYYPDKVYKVVKVLYGLHQAPKAWYETLANYLLENGFQREKIDQTLFIKKEKDGKSASTPIDTEKPLLKDPDGENVDVHIYRLMIGSLMYLTSSRPDIMFVVCACARFQVTPKVSHLHAVKRIFRHFLNAVSSKLMLFGLTIDDAHLMLLGHKASVAIKKSNDVVRLQALIDKKKVIITEDTIRQALSLDDAAGVDCLSNEEIFPELARMGYEKPSTKLTFYKYTSPALTQKVFTNMRRIGKGFLGVDIPLFDGMLVQQQVQAVEDAAEVEDDDNKTCATLSKQVANLEQDKIAQDIKITKLKQRVRRLEKKRHFKSLGLKRLRKVGTAQRVKSSADIVIDDQEDASKQGLMTEVVTTAATTITAAQVPKASALRRSRGVVIQDPKETVTTSVIVHTEAKSKDKGKGILIEKPKPLKRQAQIEQDEAFTRQLEAELNANIHWNDVLEKMKRKEKHDNTVMRYQALKRKHVTES